MDFLSQFFLTIMLWMHPLPHHLEIERHPAVNVGGEVDPTYFAHVLPDGTVDQVIVIDQETLNTGHWGDPSEWMPATRDFSKHDANVGDKYFSVIDAYIPPRPSASSTLDVQTLRWVEPPMDRAFYQASTTSTSI